MKLIKDLGIFSTDSSKTRRRYALYECDCGVVFQNRVDHVKSGHVKGCRECGLKRIGIATSNRASTHNLSSSRIYKIWADMKKRCKSNFERYKSVYKDKGISVCDEWIGDFESFYRWSMENGYKDNLSIDRINNDGNYEPNNCRWTTREVQARNTRRIYKSNTSGYRGVTKKRNKFVSRIIVNSKMIQLGTYDSATDAAKEYDKYVVDNNLEHTINFPEASLGAKTTYTGFKI